MLKTFDGDAGERAGVGEQLFLAVAQRVRGAAEHVVEIEAVDLQPRLATRRTS